MGPIEVLAPPSFLCEAVGALGEGCSSGPAGRSLMIDLYIPASSSMNQKRGRLPTAEKLCQRLALRTSRKDVAVAKVSAPCRAAEGNAADARA